MFNLTLHDHSPSPSPVTQYLAQVQLVRYTTQTRTSTVSCFLFGQLRLTGLLWTAGTRISQKPQPKRKGYRTTPLLDI